MPRDGEKSGGMIRRLRPLAATVAGLILLGWGMGVLILHVAYGFFHAGIDRPVNRWVHAHHSHGLGIALVGVAHFGSDAVALVVALVAGGLWAVRRRRVAPLVALVLAYGGGAVIALAVKVLVRRGQSGLPGGLAGVTELGFPSGHATLAAAVYGTAAVLVARRVWPAPAGDGGRAGRRRPWRRPWIFPAGLVVLALIIGVARVYNGQHDTTDVLAGWILGGLWAWALGTFRPWSERRRGNAAGAADRAGPRLGPQSKPFRSVGPANSDARSRSCGCRSGRPGHPPEENAMNTLRKALMSAGLVGSTLVGGALGAALINGTANAAETTSSTAAGASSTAPAAGAPAGSPSDHGGRGPGGPGGPGGSFDPSKGGHVGANGRTEVLLTGDTADKVKAAALAAVPGATVERAETDAEGSPYEAHMTKSDGSHVTVKVDSNFSVTGIENG